MVEQQTTNQNNEDDDDDEDDEDGAAGAAPEGEGTESDDDEYQPPTKEEYAAMLAALDKANKQAKNSRLKLKGLAAGPTSGEGERVDRAAIEAEVAAKYKPQIISRAAEAALISAGLAVPADATLRGTAIKKALRLIDMSALEIDAEGDIEGLEAEILEIKGLYPEMFQARKTQTARIDVASPGKNSKAETSAQKLAKLLPGA